MAQALRIPLARSREVLIVQPHEVREDIITILERENVPLEYWLSFSRILLSQGRIDAYQNILERLIKVASRIGRPSATEEFIILQATCSLGDLLIQKARMSDGDKRRTLLTDAYRHFSAAQKRNNMQDMMPHMGLGEIALMKGEAKMARRQFEEAAKKTCNGFKNIAGRLALARLDFSQGDFESALALYTAALEDFPSSPPEIRLGIAACQLRLGEISKAEAAYKRVLELDPPNIQALLGLAVMHLAVGATAESTQQGSRLLAQAFREDPHNPHVLALLAHFSLQQGLYGSALRLAEEASKRADADDTALQAEVLGLVGRAHHANGKLSDALEHYKKALKLDPKRLTVRLAKAQLEALRPETLRTAVASLETLLDERPGWTDALRLLAPLCPRHYAANTAIPAARHFKDAAEQGDKQDVALWEMLGDVLAGSDPSTALSAYNNAISLNRKRGTETSSIPARLLNNAAVLQLRAGNAAEAANLMAEAISSAVSGGLYDLGPQAQVTLGYNSARIREACGDIKSAESEYKALLAQFPQYSDCYLRLAYICKSRGDLKGAESWADRAGEVSNRSADALALMASLHLARDAPDAAKRHLEEMQHVIGNQKMKHEPYARLALGNVYLYSGRYDPRREETFEKAELQYGHALHLYSKVLQLYPSNIYAAHGIGCVLAECGRLSEAKEVFLSVQEAAASSDGFFRLPDAWVNLAGVYSGLQEYTAAEQTYINAMRRFPEVRDNARVQLYLAKAQSDGGRLEPALRTLCRISHLAPQDHRIRFNIAYILQRLGESVVTKNDWGPGDGGSNKVSKVTLALNRLHAALNGFHGLRSAGQKVTKITERQLDIHITHVEKLIQAGQTLLQAAEREAAAAQARLEANKLLLEQEARKRELDEKRKQLEEEARLRFQENQAKEAARKLEAMKSEWKQGNTLAKAVAAGDSSAIAKGRQREVKNERDAALDAMFEDEEDDEDFNPDQEEEGEEEQGTRGGPRNKGSGHHEQLEGTAALAAAGLISSDEEDDADFQETDEEQEEEEERKQTKQKKEKKKAGRLKKRERNEVDGARTGEEEMDDIADNVSAKRARSAAMATLEDSDVEAEPKNEEQVAPQQSEADLHVHVEPPEASTHIDTKDLFGSDSE